MNGNLFDEDQCVDMDDDADVAFLGGLALNRS